MPFQRALYIGLFCGGLLACTGDKGPAGAEGSEGKSGLVSVTAEPAGANCASGGQRIDSGVDDNGDGVLDAAEIDSTSYVCAGDAGAASLVNITAEPAGANCPDGGQRIETGVDDNRNGTLETGEVDDTAYVCNGADGAPTLIAITPEPAGANCMAGGQRIDAGLDDNGNGTLEPGEIDETAYVCNGLDASNVPPGAALWLRMDDDPTDGAIDSAGSHTTTCVSGACPTLVTARHGLGYQFTEDRITVAGAADLEPGTAFSVALWMRIDTTPTINDVVVTCKALGSNDCTYAVLVSTARQLTWYHATGGRLVSTTALAVGAWTHVAYTWDGTTKRGYINGVLDGSQAMPTPASSATEPLRFGQLSDVVPLSFPGSIDQALFYNRVLAPADIAALASR